MIFYIEKNNEIRSRICAILVRK